MRMGKMRRWALLLGGLTGLAIAGFFVARPARPEARWDRLDLPALRRAARAHPNDAALFLALGRRLRQSGELRGAGVMTRRAYDLSDGSPPFAAAKVGALVDAGDLAAAGELAVGALERWPASGELRAQLARLHAVRGRFAEALREALDAVKQAPEHPEAWRSLGLACSVHKRPEEAFMAFARARKLEPRDAELLADYGEALSRYGRTPEAEAALKEAVALAPSAARPGALLGVVRARRARTAPEREEARQLLRRALERAPTATDTMYQLAMVEVKDERPAAAVPLLHRCLSLDPTFGEAHLALGQAFQRLGQVSAANQAFAEWQRFSDYRRRAAHLELRLRRQPHAPDLLQALARLHAENGNHSLAERYRNRARTSGAGTTREVGAYKTAGP